LKSAFEVLSTKHSDFSMDLYGKGSASAQAVSEIINYLNTNNYKWKNLPKI